MEPTVPSQAGVPRAEVEPQGVDISMSGVLFLAFLFLLYKCLTRTWGTGSRQEIPEVKPRLIVGSQPTV